MSGSYPSKTPVRTPDPLQRSRRRALERLGSLRAMGLGAIGDIGSASFGSVQKITWETATEWNNATSQESVIHAGIGDHTDSLIELGTDPFESPLDPDIVSYWTLNEDSGSTATDAVGSNDGSYQGVTLGQTGPLRGTAPSFDGSDDSVQISYDSSLDTSGLTVFGWVRPENHTGDNNPRLISRRGDNGSTFQFLIQTDVSEFRWEVYDSGGGQQVQSADNSVSDNVWYWVCGSYDGSNNRLIVDGTQVDSTGVSGNINHTNQRVEIGVGSETFGNRGYLTGKFAEWGYVGVGLTQAQAEALYPGDGNLQTGTKSFSNSETPDLTDLDYTLNGETISLDVIGSPGTASEEIVTQTLDGSTSYTLSWSNSHTDFAIKANLSTSTDTVTPDVNSMTLTA